MGKSLMTYGRVIDNEETARMIEAVTAEDIRSAAAEVLAPERLSNSSTCRIWTEADSKRHLPSLKGRPT